ncbi:hypothetical protein ACEPAH_7175 [Sanghuangporus vaninii]
MAIEKRKHFGCFSLCDISERIHDSINRVLATLNHNSNDNNDTDDHPSAQSSTADCVVADEEKKKRWSSQVTTMLKGKSTTRSWATLPPEVIRLITTHYLLAMSATAALPSVWQQRENWPGRMAFTVVRDAEMLRQLMRVSPAWAAAIEYHLFWQQAAAVLDAADHVLGFARAQRVSPFKHFRLHIFQRSCIPCRINYPNSTTGLLVARRATYTHILGWVPCCREHRKERFCGVCLRDANNGENCIAENEECEYWQSVEATCRSCRAECLWKACCEGESQPGNSLTKEAEAVGGQSFQADDWEARQTVDAFVEMGEGCIRDVINLCMEKRWLRKHTKLGEMLRLAVATSRMQSRMTENATEAGIVGGNVGEYDDDEELSDLDEEDEDPELMSITEETQGVRELAMNDWARARILDGLWFSPADHWYKIQGSPNSNATRLPPGPHAPIPHVPASHPVSWSLSQSVVERQHPDPDAVCTSPPPSLTMCSAAYEAFRRQLRAILLPAMANVVRKVVMECAIDGTDASVRIAKMGVEDVANALREGGVWFNGVDWADRRRREAKDTEDSSGSEKSGSGTTSPVLSTSTLQTTPSPPPAPDVKIEGSTSPSSTAPPPPPSSSSVQTRPPSSPILSLPIAISPVLESPTQIPSIPFIPNSMSDMPPYTIETFKTIWRDACAPLFHCRCRICERAVLRANIEAGNIVPSQQYQVEPHQKQTVVPLVEVMIDPINLVGDDPPYVDIEEGTEADVEDGVESEEVEEVEDQHIQEKATPIGRKRSCEAAEIVDVNGVEIEPEEDCRTEERNQRSKTPPEKRQRLGMHEIDPPSVPSYATSRKSMSPVVVPPRSGSDTPSETRKEPVRVVIEAWEELGGLEDDGLYVMDDVSVLEGEEV